MDHRRQAGRNNHTTVARHWRRRSDQVKATNRSPPESPQHANWLFNHEISPRAHHPLPLANTTCYGQLVSGTLHACIPPRNKTLHQNRKQAALRAPQGCALEGSGVPLHHLATRGQTWSAEEHATMNMSISVSMTRGANRSKVPEYGAARRTLRSITERAPLV